MGKARWRVGGGQVSMCLAGLGVCVREREPDRETETDGPTDRQIEHYRDRSETLGQAEALWD